jgi:drug/metabolite transporter (DMT)-like permease
MTGWGALVALALISTVVAIVAFFAGIARVGPAEASTLSTVEPATTVALGALLLGEPVAVVQVLGGALILGAVVVLARARRPGLVPAEGPPT